MTHDELTKHAQRKGLTIERKGCAWHIHGRGVDVLCADLRNLHPSDLRHAEAQGAGAPGVRERRIQYQR